VSLVEQTIARLKKQQAMKQQAVQQPVQQQPVQQQPVQQQRPVNQQPVQQQRPVNQQPVKQQPMAPKKVSPAVRPPPGPAPGPVVDRLEYTGDQGRSIILNNEALRASGYIPEPDKDRHFADQYRRIKRPLIDKALSGTEVGESRIIMVTSALPGDGKTFTSINLALSMALERDISLLLVDADTPKRHISQLFMLDKLPGLLDALLDENLDTEALVVPTSTRGLSILPAGGQVTNAAELLSSNRMRKILTGLCTRNPRRVLLFDSPPLLVTNEGGPLLKLAGQVVLVVRAGGTPRHAVQEALALFDERQAGGVVLNQVPGSPTEGYYGYGSYGTDGAES
jgi:exopolysaccharide/PEP-CTERM locus tyrosine autokinase